MKTMKKIMISLFMVLMMVVAIAPAQYEAEGADGSTPETAIQLEAGEYGVSIMDYENLLPVGATRYYSIGAQVINGMAVTWYSDVISVTINDVAVANGDVVNIPMMQMRMPVSIAVTNTGAEETSIYVEANYPLGSERNPEVLYSVGDITATIAEGATTPYHYKWIVPDNGEYVFTVNKETAANGWAYSITNNTTSVGGDICFSIDDASNTYSANVSKDDEIIIWVGTSDDFGNTVAGTVDFTIDYTAVLGTYSNPLPGDMPLTTDSIPAGETVYYNVSGLNGAILSVNNTNFSVSVDGNPYIEGELVSAWGPTAVLGITNNGIEASTVTVTAEIPVGTSNNPEKIVLGENTTDIKENAPGVYFYTWTAPCDGTFKFEIGTATNGWQYQVENKTTSVMSEMYDHDYTPDDKAYEVEVKKGDVLVITVGTFDPNNWFGLPVGTVANTTSFVAAHTYGEYSDWTVAADGASKSCEKVCSICGDKQVLTITINNTTVEDKKDADSVNGLDKFVEQKGENVTVEIEKDATKVDEADSKKIAEVATDKYTLSFFEITLIDATGAPITTTGDIVLELKISYADAAKAGLVVYRNHEGTVAKLTALTAKPASDYTDATYYVDKEKKCVYIYSSKYSTYAIGTEVVVENTNPSNPQEPSKGDTINKTGDVANTGIYMVMLLGVAVIAAGAVAKKRYF